MYRLYVYQIGCAPKDPIRFLKTNVLNLKDKSRPLCKYLHDELQKVKSSGKPCPSAAQIFKELNKSQSMTKTTVSVEEQRKAIEHSFCHKEYNKAMRKMPCDFCGKLESETGSKLRICDRYDGISRNSGDIYKFDLPRFKEFQTVLGAALAIYNALEVYCQKQA